MVLYYITDWLYIFSMNVSLKYGFSKKSLRKKCSTGHLSEVTSYKINTLIKTCWNTTQGKQDCSFMKNFNTLCLLPNYLISHVGIGTSVVNRMEKDVLGLPEKKNEKELGSIHNMNITYHNEMVYWIIMLISLLVEVTKFWSMTLVFKIRLPLQIRPTSNGLHNKTPCKKSHKIRLHEWIFGLFSKYVLKMCPCFIWHKDF